MAHLHASDLLLITLAALSGCAPVADLEPEIDFTEQGIEIDFREPAGSVQVTDGDDRVVWHLAAQGETNPIAPPYILGDLVENARNELGAETVDLSKADTFTVHLLRYRDMAHDNTVGEGWATWVGSED